MAVLPTATSVLPEASGGTGTTTGYYGFKNRIINGGMVIDQRNAGASVTPAQGVYVLDRWRTETSGGGIYTVQRSATAPAGFTNSMVVTVTTADSSIAAGDFYDVEQFIEGFNIADLGWGTANAQTVTLSFWVRSSVTGTFAGALINSDSNRSYVFTYTINSANTFEQKTITIAGDTSGTWLTTTGRGIGVFFDLGNGSSSQATAGSWSATYAVGTSTSVKLISTLNATWYITGVQLEKGSTATSFDYRPYGTELQLCQRYYRQTSGTSNTEPSMYGYALLGTNLGTTIVFPVPMRTAPTITVKSGSFTVSNCASPSFITSSDAYLVFSSATANGSTYFQSGTAVLAFNGAEL
jgi:hypothetical protein